MQLQKNCNSKNLCSIICYNHNPLHQEASCQFQKTIFFFQIRLYYNAMVELSLSQLEVIVHYFNESGYAPRPRYLTSEYRMNIKNEGWNRWEAVLPSDIQLR